MQKKRDIDMSENPISSLLWEKEDRPEIIEVRHRFFKLTVYPFLIFGFLATITGSLQTYQQGRWIFAVLYAGGYLIFAVTALAGRRIPMVMRSLALILALFALAVSALMRIGLSGIGLELLLLACAVSSALMGRKAGLILVSIGAFAMLIIGGGMVSGILPIRAEHMLTSLSPLAWGTSLMVFSMVGVGLVTIPQMFFTRLKESLSLLEGHTGALEQSNVSMKETINAREEAEKALRESEEKYRVLVENAGEAIYIAQDGKLRFMNKRGEELSGYTSEELIFKHFGKLIHEDDRAFVLERHANRQQGIAVPSNYSFRIIHKSGEVKWVELNVVVIDWQGEHATLNFLRDITERKQTEKMLRESEEKLARSKKMESIGLLAGGVAHDLNNVLSGIVSYPELLLLDLPEDSNLRKPIETIQESGHRATAIVQDLLTVARGVATIKGPVNLNDLVSYYLNSLEFSKLEQFQPTVTIKTSLDNDLFNVNGSRVHIGKVVMNLVSNAAEAIDGSGNVTISTMNRYVDRPLRGYDDVNRGEYAILSVSDNGPGISSDDLERIFEPFYTKKVMGRSGTGLGLAVVWNVVQDHNGYIDVTTDKNGTTFELYFPLTRDEIPDKNLSMPIEDYTGNGEIILVIDDVESQRDISCKMLEALGYKTKAVSSGEDAVKYLKENSVDLLLLDMIMDPGINGRETYKRIKENHPNQKAIIVSGFAETNEVRKAQKLGAGQYIKKPLTLKKIGLAVKEELGKDSSG
jgi:two-component system, cell cycle sensor histidine kinase and response regulator CckA